MRGGALSRSGLTNVPIRSRAAWNSWYVSESLRENFAISARSRSSPWSVIDRPSGNGTKRSEEHTSELQSRPHLVCRLLLEKKKNVRSSLSNRHNSEKRA